MITAEEATRISLEPHELGEQPTAEEVKAAQDARFLRAFDEGITVSAKNSRTQFSLGDLPENQSPSNEVLHELKMAGYAVVRHRETGAVHIKWGEPEEVQHWRDCHRNNLHDLI